MSETTGTSHQDIAVDRVPSLDLVPVLNLDLGGELDLNLEAGGGRSDIIDLTAVSDGDAEGVGSSRVAVWALDPLMARGLAVFVHRCLDALPSVHVGGRENASRLGRELAARADVVVVAASAWAVPARQLARAAGLSGAAVVWIGHTDGDHHGGPDDAAEELPIAGVLRRSELADGRQLQVGLRALLLGQNWPGETFPARSVAMARRRGPDGAAVGGAPRALRLNSVEVEVLSLLAAGQDTAQIAAELFYSERTVKNYISRAVNRLGVRNRTQAVAAAVRRGLL